MPSPTYRMYVPEWALQRIKIMPKTRKLVGDPYVFRETIYPIPETYFPAMDQVAMYMLQLNR